MKYDFNTVIEYKELFTNYFKREIDENYNVVGIEKIYSVYTNIIMVRFTIIEKDINNKISRVHTIEEPEQNVLKIIRKEKLKKLLNNNNV